MTAPARRVGYCPVCGEPRTPTKDGSVRRHTGNKRVVWPPEDCDGTGRLAVAEPPDTAEEPHRP